MAPQDKDGDVIENDIEGLHGKPLSGGIFLLQLKIELETASYGNRPFFVNFLIFLLLIVSVDPQFLRTIYWEAAQSTGPSGR